jgi:hypothetical protein
MYVEEHLDYWQVNTQKKQGLSAQNEYSVHLSFF